MPETPPRRPVAPSRPAGPQPASAAQHAEGPGDDQPLIRIRSVADLIRIIPHQIGFPPTESLVIQCLEDDRATRVMRIDLPSAAEPWERDLALLDMSAHLAGQMDPDRESCLVVVYSQLPSAVCRAEDVRAFFRIAGRSVLATAVVDTRDILVLSPDGGVADSEPLDVPDSPALSALRAAHALSGRRMLADRAELAASIAAPEGIGRAVGRRAVAAADDELDRIGAVPVGARAVPEPRLLAVLEDALAEIGTDGAVELGTAARLATYCRHSADRDALLSRMVRRRSEPWIPALVSALRRIPAEDSVDLCSVLAVLAYRDGDGALAQVAADRALRSDPHHRLTLLMLDIMHAGMPPSSLDGMGETPP